MKIHTNTLTYGDLHRAAEVAGPGVYAESVQRGSRSRHYAYDVRLTSDGTPDVDGTPRNRRPNSGQYGADRSERAASWADWGRFLGYLYAQDDSLVTPYYASIEEFHEQTGHRFHYSSDGLHLSPEKV